MMLSMNSACSASVAIVISVGLTAFGVERFPAPRHMTLHAQAASDRPARGDFQAMLAGVDAAQLDLQNGKCSEMNRGDGGSFIVRRTLK